MNRSEYRIVKQVSECFPRKRQYVLREAIHTLAQQGVIEYEAAHRKGGNVVSAWLSVEDGNSVARVPAKLSAKEYLRSVTESVCRESNAPKDMLDTICQLERQANIFEAAYTALIEDKKELCETLAERAGELNRKNKEILTLRAELDRMYDEHSSDNHNNCKKETTMATITLDIENMDVDSLGAKMQGVIIRAEVPNDSLPAFLGLVAKITSDKTPHVCKCEVSNGNKRPEAGNAFAPNVD